MLNRRVRRTWWGYVLVIAVPVLGLGLLWSLWIGGDELADTVASKVSILEPEAQQILRNGPDSSAFAPIDRPQGIETASTPGELGDALRSLGITRRFRAGTTVVFAKPEMGYYGEGELVYATDGSLHDGVEGECPADAAAPKQTETRHLLGAWYSVLTVECDPFSTQTDAITFQHFVGWTLFVPAAALIAGLFVIGYRRLVPTGRHAPTDFDLELPN